MAKTKNGAPSGAIVKWDEELAKQAEVAAKMEENSGGGQFFSVRAGVLSWNDAPVPDNQMGVIILDSILENVWYETEFDPDNPSGPSCFAFGRDEDGMTPHDNVVKAGTAQEGPCKSCPMNEWGSADKGKGKACRNTRRLAMIPAGTFRNGKFEPFEEVEHFEQTAFGFMKLPVTSVKGYASFVKQVASSLKRPPHGVVTRVKVVPDAKTQFKVTFEPIMNVPNEVLGAVFKRREEAMATIDFPYQPPEEKPAAKGRGAKPQKQRRY